MSRSYQCPPNSCRNPVIPAESGGIKFGRKACYFFSFRCLLFRRNLGIPELRPECSAEFAGTECNGIWLFVCLFVSHLLPNKPPTKHRVTWSPFVTPPPPPPLPPHQRRPQRRPMTTLPPRQRQRTTITDDHSRPPRNDDKPPKMNTNDGQHKNGHHPQKTNHGPWPPPTTAHKRRPAPTNGHRQRRLMTRDQDNDEGQGTTTMMMIIVVVVVLYLIL